MKSLVHIKDCVCETCCSEWGQALESEEPSATERTNGTSSHELERLRAENDELRQQLAEQRRLHSAFVGSLRNPSFKPTVRIVGVLAAIDAHWRADRGRGGRVQVGTIAARDGRPQQPGLADRIGISPDTLSRSLEQLHDAKVLRREVFTKRIDDVDRQTGEVKRELRRWVEITPVEPSLAQTLALLTASKPGTKKAALTNRSVCAKSAERS
jgi:hypothetical protein